jgi:hypothetical protein
MHEEHKVVLTGCSFCQKHFGTAEQFKFHVTHDVLPPLLDKLSTEANEIQQSNVVCAVEQLQVLERGTISTWAALTKLPRRQSAY